MIRNYEAELIKELQSLAIEKVPKLGINHANALIGLILLPKILN